MPEAQTITLTPEQITGLEAYAQVLDRYTQPGVREFFPIGWRRIPKAKQMEATQLSLTKRRLEARLGIQGKYGFGDYTLELKRQTPFELPRHDMFRPERIMDLFPIKSGSKAALEYLSGVALPKVFTEDIMPSCRFSIRYNFVTAHI